MSQTNLRIFRNFQKLNGISAQKFISGCLDTYITRALREMPLRDDLADVSDFKLTYNGVKIIVSNMRVWEYVKINHYQTIRWFTGDNEKKVDDMIVGLKTPVGWIYNGRDCLLPTNIHYHKIIRNLPEEAVVIHFNVNECFLIDREPDTHIFPADFPTSGAIIIQTRLFVKYCDKKFIGKDKINLPIKNVSDEVIRAIEEIMGEDWRRVMLVDIADIVTYLDILLYLGGNVNFVGLID